MTISAYPKYENYKDSGVDGFGDIPNYWEVQRNFALFRESKQAGRADLPVLSVSIHSGVSREQLSDEDNVRSIIKIEDRTAYKRVSPEDIAYNMMRAWQGGIGRVQVDGMVSPAYVVAKPNKGVCSSYLERQFRSPAYISSMDAASKGITDFRKRLYWENFRDLGTIVPPLPEQRAIAAFLDTKCGRIDEAVRIKEEQIALLKERRQILIQQAVTRGLNPDAPMKDSGIDWIGEIPAHWEVRSIRYAFRFRNNQRVPLSGSDREHMQGQYPYYGASGIIDYVEDYIFDEDLILIAEDGANLLSKSTPLAFVASGKYWVNNHAHILEPLFPGFEYWAEMLSAVDYTTYISGSAQPKLTRDRLGSVRVPVPPPEELEDIIRLINEQSQKFRNAISLKESQITALKEYKTSLINAAVTGKIKVS